MARDIARRQFLLGLGAGLAVGGGGVAALRSLQAGLPAGTVAADTASVPGTIDPNTIRRRGVGFRGSDPQRVSPGFTLFAPMTGGGVVYLIDIQGNVTHTWTLPYPPGLYGYLTDRGTLFYNGQIPNDTFLGKQPFMGGSVLEMDWNGRILWELKRPDHHHDGRLLKNGNVILLCGAELPGEVAKRVRGGRAGSESEGGKMWSDVIVETTTDGRVVWEWKVWEHLDPAVDGLTALQDERAEWTHANSVWEDADGSLLVSFRNISTVIRIDRGTGNIVWKLGAPPLSGQHAPHMLANGNMLLFDNGPHRLDESYPFSRVIEINPATKAIAWKYQEARTFNFYSPRISNAQRLPNGNTLINEGVFGRFFEVPSAGEVVWEYANPHFGPPTAAVRAQQSAWFPVYRYSEEEIARIRR